MEIRNYRQAVLSALKWLLAQQDSDGSIKPVEHGLNTFHKVPYVMALTGQMERGSRLCAWIQQNSLDEEGDFASRTHREGPLSSFYSYSNSWLIMGAHRLGQFGISLRAADFLTTLQHPQTGGFLTLGPESSLDGMQDIMTSSLAGLALLTTGKVAEAEAVGDFLVSMYDRQPRLNAQLLFVQQKGDRLVNEFPEDQAPAFALTLRQPGQWYFVPGLAGGFLAKLYDVNGNQEHLRAAQNYIQFADSSGNDRYDGPNAWWFGWGAAMVYASTGIATHRRIIEAVCDNMVESQMSNGTWAAGSMGYEPPAPIIDGTAEAVVALTEMLQALIIGE
ncbi:MAG: hypothetical protein ACM3VW_10710 [Bacteroidota bacterium]